MKHSRWFHGACAQADKFLYVSGGACGPDKCRKSVERYQISTDSWMEMPRLNVGRHSHASCATNSAVFVFCGFSANQVGLASIEVLQTPAISQRTTRVPNNRWQMIDASGSGLTPRCGLGAVPLNSLEIAIMGGYTEESSAE